LRKLFSFQFNDEDTQATDLELPTSTMTTRYQPEKAFTDNYTNGNTSSQHLFKTEREKLLAIVEQMRQAANLEVLFETTVAEVRKSLKADRVLIYRFESSTHGVAIAEARGREWTPVQGEKLVAAKFGLEQSSEYLAQNVVKLSLAPNGTQAQPTPYQLQLMQRLQVKSSLALPILIEREVWGLLVVQQCSAPRQWQEVELSLLYQIVTELTVNIQSWEFKRKLSSQTEYTRTVTQVATRVMDKICRSVDINTVFSNTTYELLQLLKVDRVAVYRFNSDWSGEFISESVTPGWMPLVGAGIKTVWEDSHLQQTQGGRYVHNETFAIDNIYQAGHSACHVEILEQFQIKAYAIAPIFFGSKLWGLLAAYQNSGPRHWEEVDITCLSQVSTQLGVALKQAEYLQQVEVNARELEQVAEQERTVARTVDRIRKSLEIDTVCQITTQEVRKLFQADRVVVFRFNPDWSGEFVAESVGSNLTAVIGKQLGTIVSDCGSLNSLKSKSGGERFYRPDPQNGKTRSNLGGFSIDDITSSEFAPEYQAAMDQMDAKAYVTTSIFVEDKLWGLLAVYQSQPRHWKKSEEKLLVQIGTQFEIALQQATTLEQLRRQSQQLAQAAEQERAVAGIIEKVRKSLDLDTIFRATTQEVRKSLQADRVGIYRFNPDWSGVFVAESVTAGWTPLITEKIDSEVSDCNSVRGLGGEKSDRVEDTYLQQTQGGRYQQNRQGFWVDDIYKAGFSPCYIETLERFEARAYVTTPIFAGEKLWGLLAVYQNSGARHWQESEVRLLSQVATQMGIGVQQAENLAQLRAQSQQLTEAAAREKAAKEKLQMRAIQLLTAVKPAFDGNLTVRAPVTEDEMGTIADAYNNTLQSLRQLVVQVKNSAANVTQTSCNSESAISNLANSAQFQFQQLNQTLEQIKEMTNATQAVSANAQQVEIAVLQANQTVSAGDNAMNRTVDGILNIRETVAETGKKIKRLSESSQKISRVVNLIGYFTSQTQLLALNASIEATRAGEYGRGFAVVADEVRSLARQSAAATTEIEKLVQEIQTETIEVAAATETGIQQVVEGTNLVNETRRSLNEIVAATTSISKLVEGITQATMAQTHQSQSVTQTMTDLAVVATKTSVEAVEISTSFKELLEMAAELQASVGQFKVS